MSYQESMYDLCIVAQDVLVDLRDDNDVNYAMSVEVIDMFANNSTNIIPPSRDEIEEKVCSLKDSIVYKGDNRTLAILCEIVQSDGNEYQVTEKVYECFQEAMKRSFEHLLNK